MFDLERPVFEYTGSLIYGQLTLCIHKVHFCRGDDGARLTRADSLELCTF